ncbi:endo-alpha-N-acetylgalactosaminidase family protein [Paenibacillus sp. GCM10023252]|uniref:galactose-binding domain-containing protein n=1 Tax=Paenibacillus sp. GCM10023252 TaxID=3252649 RepID=UPI00361ABA5E
MISQMKIRLRKQYVRWATAFLCMLTLISATPLFYPEEAHAASATISSNSLTVEVDRDFPRVIQYVKTGKVIYGQENSLSKVKINGALYTPVVTSTMTSSNVITYTLTISSLSISITLVFEVAGDVLSMNITAIDDSGTTKVNTLEIPDWNLISVKQSQAGSAMAYNLNYESVDTIGTVANKAVDSSPVQAGHTILYTNQLAAAIEVSLTSQNVYVQTVQQGTDKRTGAWPFEYLYRGPGGEAMDLPWAKVVITEDRNNDSTIDWQDGALAYRDIMDPMPGETNDPANQLTENKLAQQTTFMNIALNYRGRYPWTYENMLDTLKRQALATDNFPQMVELKNWLDNVGHPQIHGTEMLGGDDKLNWFIDEAKNWNISVGLHTDNDLTYKASSLYDATPKTTAPIIWEYFTRLSEGSTINLTEYWQSHLLNQRYDALRATFPNLKFGYVDVKLVDGGPNSKWQLYQIVKQFKKNGWNLATEFPVGLNEYNADIKPYAKGGKQLLWVHAYMDDGDSNIRRFIMNDKTIFGVGDSNYQNLLGYANKLPTDSANQYTNYGYLGWSYNNNYNNGINGFWKQVLVDTYLKNFKLTKVFQDSANNNNWTAWLDHNVKSVYDGTYRNVYRDNVLYAKLNDSTQELFVPYEPVAENKILTYMSAGGTRTWTLPQSWNGLSTVKLYKLSDTEGRVYVQDLPVTNNQVTINYLAKQGYVILKGASAQAPVIWGEGSSISDFEFNSGAFASWTKSGTAAITIETDANANRYLKIAGSPEGSVSQTISGLTPGKSYAITVFGQSEGNREASLEVSNYGGSPVASSINGKITVAKERLDWPLLKVNFTLPAGQTTAKLTLRGLASNSGAVTFDDLRLREEENPYGAGGHYYYDGFESTHWAGPFMHDETADLAAVTNLNDLKADGTHSPTPFTIDTITGNHSMRVYYNTFGTVVKTLPSLLKFMPNKTYKLSFKYKPLFDSAAGWSFKLSSPGKRVDYGVTALNGAQDTINTASLQFSTRDLDDVQLQFVNSSNKKGTDQIADLVIDDLTVDEVTEDGSTVLPLRNLAYGKAPTFSTTSVSSSYLATDNDASNSAAYTKITASGPQWMQIDLGGIRTLNELQVWHYYADSRTYRDVILQVSNDPTFQTNVTTVFNNDANNSAGQGIGTDAEYAETKNGKTVVFNPVQARYIRLWTNGNSVNSENHYVDVRVLNSNDRESINAFNPALGRTPTFDTAATNAAYATDGTKNKSVEYAKTTAAGPHWMQLDLGASYNVSSLKVWHYYFDARTYRDVIMQVSNDPTFQTGVSTVFNNDADNSAGQGVGNDAEYAESSAGKEVNFAPINARYVRFWANGNSLNSENHYLEVEVNVAANLAANLKPTFSTTNYLWEMAATNGSIGDWVDIKDPGSQWMQLDLGRAFQLNTLKVLHYYNDSRTYRDVIMQVSNDPTFQTGVTTVFNNDANNSSGQGVGNDAEYVETSSGKAVTFSPVNARYVRLWTNGSTANAYNHYAEVEVYGQ